MFASLLIANRGEIARRIIRTARRMDVRTIAVMTEADRSWPHWREADEAVLIGDGPAGESYLSIERIIGAARNAGADAIHPGYGFLSETPAFAEACAAAGIVFVGPPASAIRAMGSKGEAKGIMSRAGIPVVPGYSGKRQEPDFLRQKAYEIGYPVLIKAIAGGGGRGMRRIDRVIDFDAGLRAAKREALAAFGDERVLLERYVETPRHVEVQVFADEHGNAVHLFERDCSVQRRHQKVIEEAPAPGLPPEMRRKMGEAAVKAALAVGYRGAGTVEFVVDCSRGSRPDNYFFIEMNTRLQVEHPVTEAITGIDLVEWQLRVAAGETLPMGQAEISLAGHAVEARIYAEAPSDGFRPSTGRLWAVSFPSAPGIRIDSGVGEGTEVTPFYDAMLAKVIAFGDDRMEAVRRLIAALDSMRLVGPDTNLRFLSAIARHRDFLAGGVDTGFVERALHELIGAPLDPSLAASAVTAHVTEAGQRSAAAASGPWARTDAIELGGLERKSELAVDLDGARTTAAIAWPEGKVRVASIDGRAPSSDERPEIFRAGHDLFVVQEGRQLRVSFPDPLARDVEAAALGGKVVVPMPARVVEVSVITGAAVTKGDTLFTLEAMKMEHDVLAPLAGTVTAVCVAAGQQVGEGTLAVVITPVES